MSDAALRMLMMAGAVAVHLGLALVIGSLASQAWLWSRSSAWSRSVDRQALQARRAGFVLAMLGAAAALWFEAAAMGDTSLLSAGPTIGKLLGHTHFGHAWLIGTAAWLAAAFLLLGRPGDAPHAAGFALGLLAVAIFVLTRSVVSHAGSRGDLTLDVGVDWVHLVLVCMWIGIVIAGAGLILPPAAAASDDRRDATRWVASMSTFATIAILGIGATGLFKAWRGWASIGSTGPYLDSGYGHALIAKLGLVAVAAALGGYNRFIVLPGLFRELAGARGADEGGWRRRLLAILRLEAGTLVLVLVAAAVLSNSELPGSS